MKDLARHRRMSHAYLLLAALFFSGCSILSPTAAPIEPDPVPSPAPEPQPDIVVVEPEPTPEPDVPIEVPALPALPSVAIVLTSGQPAYANIAAALMQRFEHFVVYDLSDNNRTPVATIRQINDSDSSAVVAIGLRAAQSSVAMSRTPVIFSQVFNYHDHNLLIADNRGVAAFAPLAAQIDAWLEFDAGIKRIGTIVGPGHDKLIAAARSAAQKKGIALRVEVTRSDQETRFIFKRMVRDIDGFWLFADNRILSRRVLLEIMSDAERRDVSVLVPSESMLQIGASISISTVAANIADTITQIVRDIQAGKVDQVPPLSLLSEIRVRTNSSTRMAKQQLASQ